MTPVKRTQHIGSFSQALTLWKSLENSLFFHFFWKTLETSGNIWIWDDFLFWKSLENAFALKLKILILRKRSR